MALTGRFDFRKTLSGRLVLLLEEDVAMFFSRLRKRSTRRRWRRARVMDLAAIEMRQLMDLRVKPNYQAPVRSFVEEHRMSKTEQILGNREGLVRGHRSHSSWTVSARPRGSSPHHPKCKLIGGGSTHGEGVPDGKVLC